MKKKLWHQSDFIGLRVPQPQPLTSAVSEVLES